MYELDDIVIDKRDNSRYKITSCGVLHDRFTLLNTDNNMTIVCNESFLDDYFAAPGSKTIWHELENRINAINV